MTLGAAALAAPAAAQQLDAGVFDAVERELLREQDALSALPRAERLPRWTALVAAPVNRPVRYQAYMALTACQLAGPDHVEQTLQAARALAQLHPGEPHVEVALLKCRQWVEEAAGRKDGSFELSARAYRQLEAGVTLASVRYTASSNFAADAMVTGFLDEALKAVQQALRIAQANQDARREANCLGTLALTQSALGSDDDALRNNARALELATEPGLRLRLTLNRGYMQITAGELEEALTTYAQGVTLARQQGNKEQELIVKTNLADIYTRTNRLAENLALTRDLLKDSEKLGMPYVTAYAELARAFALMSDGQTAPALRLAASGFKWFEEGKEFGQLADVQQQWGELLMRKGHHREAAQALSRSLALREKLQVDARAANALYLSKALESAQKDLSIERLQRSNEIGRLQLDKERLSRNNWVGGVVGVVVVGMLLLVFHLRLRRSNRQLALINEALDFESSRDPLTRMFNRRYFDRFLEQRRALAPGPALLMLLDIDFFKKVNDEHGHGAGDQVLQEVSRRLAACMRQRDRIVRWGGEEFLVFIDKPDNEDASKRLVQRLLAAVQEAPIEVDSGALLQVTVSIGFLDLWVDAQIDQDAALREVDAFLYQAKHAGRNRAVGRLGGSEAPPATLVAAEEPLTLR